VAHLHAEAVKRFGGLPGARDFGLLESAIARPRHRWAHDEGATLHDLAAVYAEAIVRNHAFVDGNKRAALLATRAFLYLNGIRFDPPEAATVAVFEAAAAGEADPTDVSAWIRAHCRPR
jgi:death-on-curing protein